MSKLPEAFETLAPTWQARGYRLGAQADGKPIVEGDCGQFYCDAVANDAQAAQLMEHLRNENPVEYARYREDASDDGIDLDESQSIFLGTGAIAWAGM